VVADALSRLHIEEVPRPIEEISTLLDTVVKAIIEFPLHKALIYHEQLKGKGLREKAADKPHSSLQNIEGYDLLCFKDKIYISQPLRQRIISLYHEYLLHPGQTRIEQTIRNTMT
jgi:hypothetical protein